MEILNNLVGDVKAIPREFYPYINSQKKRFSRYMFNQFEKEKWRCNGEAAMVMRTILVIFHYDLSQ